MIPLPPRSTLFPYTTLFRSEAQASTLATELVRARLDVLRMQLNPHFLFNTLHAISALIHEHPDDADRIVRSEEHTSELQSHSDLVCRLLLEKKNKQHAVIH